MIHIQTVPPSSTHRSMWSCISLMSCQKTTHRNRHEHGDCDNAPKRGTHVEFASSARRATTASATRSHPLMHVTSVNVCAVLVMCSLNTSRSDALLTESTAVLRAGFCSSFRTSPTRISDILCCSLPMNPELLLESTSCLPCPPPPTAGAAPPPISTPFTVPVKEYISFGVSSRRTRRFAAS